MLRRSLFALALIVTLAGCIRLGDKPPEALMGLTSDARIPPGTARTTRDSEAIGVAIPAVPSALRNQRIAVQSGAAFAYLPKAGWIDAPAQLFRALLAETIAAKTGRFVPDSRNMAVTPDTRLGGTLTAFQLLGGQGHVLVVYDATLASSGSEQIRTRRFEATAPVGKEDAASVTAALNRAANAVADDVAAWVAAG